MTSAAWPKGRPQPRFVGGSNTTNPRSATGRPLPGRNAGEMVGIGCLLKQSKADGMALRCQKIKRLPFQRFVSSFPPNSSQLLGFARQLTQKTTALFSPSTPALLSLQRQA